MKTGVYVNQDYGWVDTDDIKIINVSEDYRGRDEVTFLYEYSCRY